MPADHHAVPAVALVPLGHQVRLPRAKLLRIRGTRGALAPPLRITGLERGVDELSGGRAEVVAGDEAPAHVPQLAFGFLVLPGGDQFPDADVGGQREQAQQQPTAQLARSSVSREAAEGNSPVNAVRKSGSLSTSRVPQRRITSSLTAARALSKRFRAVVMRCKSEGYERIARARQASTSFSEASANNPSGNPSWRNRRELVELAQ